MGASKRDILRISDDGIPWAIYEISRDGRNFKSELVKLRAKLRAAGKDFAADDFFGGDRATEMFRNRGELVGDALDILHDVGATVDVAAFATERNYSRPILKEVIAAGGVRRMLASRYWDDHPKDLVAVKKQLMGLRKNFLLDTETLRKVWAIGGRDGKKWLAKTRAELRSFGSDLAKADFFGMDSDRSGQQVPRMLLCYGGLETVAGIGLVLDLMHKQKEHVSVEELTKVYGKPGKSILSQVVESAGVTKMFASRYWDDHPEDRAALKKLIPSIANNYRSKFVRDLTINNISIMQSIADGVYLFRIYEYATLPVFRDALQSIGSDLEKADFFGSEKWRPQLLSGEAIPYIGAVMDLMGEIGETVSVSELNRKYGEHSKISLVSEAIEHGAVAQLLSSAYWKKHPEDLAQLWETLPRYVRRDVETPAIVAYAKHPTLEHLRRPQGMVRRYAHKETNPAHMMELPLYQLVHDGHSDYLLSRLEKSGEKLTLDDCLLGKKAGLPTLAEMMIEQGHLVDIMNPERWSYGEDGIGRLLIGLSVPPEMLKAQTGLNHQNLLKEFESYPLGKLAQEGLRETLGKLAEIKLKPEEIGDPELQAVKKDEQGDWRLEPLEPVALADAAEIVRRISLGESLAELAVAPKPITMTQAEMLVARMEEKLEASQAEVAEKQAEIDQLREALAEKPRTVIQVRQPTVSERVSDLAALINVRK